MLRELVLTIGYAGCVCAGLMFLVAGLAKLRERATLAAVVANYRLLPQAAVAPVAALLPWLELALGVALLVGARPVAPLAGGTLLAVFALAIEINIRRGRAYIDCGCGLGGLRQPLRRAFVVRNVVLAALMLPAAFVPGTLPAIGHITALATGFACFLLLLLLTALLALPGADRRTA